uniref:Amine oxidase domain-containing protein n=1 Tax=viral metagenome TaxID=1070528 RepID=A0A6C0DRY1_9ZZZZ
MTNYAYYDVIIVGGGIAGLYSAYQIKKLSPKTSILILERDKRSWLGGRMNNVDFQGVSVVTGAGVGRKNKDHLLIDLCNKLKITYNEFPVKKHYSKTLIPIDIGKIISHLKSKYNKVRDSQKTFKEFAEPILGKDVYKNLLICSAYTDYENEDAYETLYYYGFDDNYKSWIALGIPWHKLVEKLAHKVGMENIKTSSNVVGIHKMDECECGFLVELSNGKKFTCLKTIIATTISSVKKLVPGADNPNSIYQQIHGQTFLRVYGKFDKASNEIMKREVPTQTIVPGPLHRIIPMNENKGVYMIAYTDNDGAKQLKDKLENNEKNREFFCGLLEKSLGLPSNSLHLKAILDFYWPIGTHYYEPLRELFKDRNQFIKAAQYPMPGMLIVGEMISRKQGWTEGALESVNAVVTKQWIDWKC